VYITSVFKDNKLVRRPKTVEIEVYLAAFAYFYGRILILIRIHTNIYGSGSGMPKKLTDLDP
jgi:hypothetical protein